MSAAWTIARESDAAVTLGAWGITRATRTLNNQAADELSLTIARGAGILADLPFAVGDMLTLWRDSTRWFQGKIDRITRAADGPSHSLTILAYGPWKDMERLVYMQSRKYVTDPLANPTPVTGSTLDISDFTTTTKLSSKIFLQEDEDGEKVATDGTVSTALAYAIGKGIAIQAGTIDAGESVPRQEYSDQTVADIITRALAWTPGQVTYIDHSTTPPTIHAREKAARTVHTIDLADADVTALDLHPRPDLQLAGVRINYLREHERDDFSFYTLDVDEAGDDPTGVNGLVMTFELYGSYLYLSAEDTYSVADPEEVPTGLAGRLYAAYSESAWEGSITLKQTELPLVNWLTRRIAIAGGRPEWAGLAIAVQSVSEEICSAETTLTIGPPAHLSGGDFIELLRFGKPTTPDEYVTPTAVIATTGGTPKTSDTVASSTSPSMSFEPGSYDVILQMHVKNINAGCIGQGMSQSYAADKIDIYDKPGGTVSQTISAGATVGTIRAIAVGGSIGTLRVAEGAAKFEGEQQSPSCGGPAIVVPFRTIKMYLDGSPDE
jgi:hypothetical protein